MATKGRVGNGFPKGNQYAKGSTTNGRPTLYREEYKEQAYNYCLLGATDKEMSGFFGVDEKTFNTWKHEHDDFHQSLKNGREIADAEIGRSLHDRAKGYSKKVTKPFYDSKRGEVVYAEYIEEWAPDPTSMIYWLKNRRRTNWKDKTEVELLPDNPIQFVSAVPEPVESKPVKPRTRAKAKPILAYEPEPDPEPILDPVNEVNPMAELEPVGDLEQDPATIPELEPELVMALDINEPAESVDVDDTEVNEPPTGVDLGALAGIDYTDAAMFEPNPTRITTPLKRKPTA